MIGAAGGRISAAKRSKRDRLCPQRFLSRTVIRSCIIYYLLARISVLLYFVILRQMTSAPAHRIIASIETHHLYPEQILDEALVGELVHERRQGVVSSVQQQQGRAPAIGGPAHAVSCRVVLCRANPTGERRPFSNIFQKGGVGRATKAQQQRI